MTDSEALEIDRWARWQFGETYAFDEADCVLICVEQVVAVGGQSCSGVRNLMHVGRGLLERLGRQHDAEAARNVEALRWVEKDGPKYFAKGLDVVLRRELIPPKKN